MFTRQLYPLIILFIILSSCSHEKDRNALYREKAPAIEQYEIVYEIGNWSHPDYKHSFESLGNQRIQLEVDEASSGPVRVIIPWRRPDINPAGKAVIIVEAESAKVVKSILLEGSNNEYGDLAFEPLPGAPLYYAYYLPHRSTGGYYPRLSYIPPEEENKLILNVEQINELPLARVVSAQSIDEFHSFFPMEVIATKNETDQYVLDNPSSYFLFPEYREYPIKMDHKLPQRWIHKPANGLMDTVLKGEYYAFQVGVWSPENNLNNINVSFSDLVCRNDEIPAAAMTCFNLGGVDLDGKAFSKRLDIPASKVQTLWFGIEIPNNANAGTYTAEVIIQPEGNLADTVFLRLQVKDEQSLDHGDNEPEKMSRLRWLNSTVGSDNDFIAKPFVPVEVEDMKLHILGREVQLDSLGFPSGIYSYFTQEMTRLSEQGEALLAAPIKPELLLKDGEAVRWEPKGYSIRQSSPGGAKWSVISSSGPIQMTVDGSIEYDGMLDYKISLLASEDVEIQDFILHLPLQMEAAEFMLGLGYKGGKRPGHVDWKWEVD